MGVASDLQRMKLPARLGPYINAIAKLIVGKKMPVANAVAIVKDTVDAIMLAIISYNRLGNSDSIKIASYDDIFTPNGIINSAAKITLENPNNEDDIKALEAELNAIQATMITAVTNYKDTFPSS